MATKGYVYDTYAGAQGYSHSNFVTSTSGDVIEICVPTHPHDSGGCSFFNARPYSVDFQIKTVLPELIRQLGSERFLEALYICGCCAKMARELVNSKTFIAILPTSKRDALRVAMKSHRPEVALHKIGIIRDEAKNMHDVK